MSIRVQHFSGDSHQVDEDTEVSERERCLDVAKQNITGHREQDYGSLEDNFGTIAAYWATHIKATHGVVIPLEDTDVAIMMSLLKLARLGTNPAHFDSWSDNAGYSAAGWELASRKSRDTTCSRNYKEVCDCHDCEREE